MFELSGVLSQELGSSALFLFLVAILSITFFVLSSFREPYLECVKITKRRKAAVAPSPGPSFIGVPDARRHSVK